MNDTLLSTVRKHLRNSERGLLKLPALTLTLLLVGMVIAPAVLAERAPSRSLAQASDELAGTIQGVVYQDWDQDGARDDQEPTLAGALVTLHDIHGIERGQVMTELDGAFAFGNLAPGAYILEEEDAMGYSTLGENESLIALVAGQTIDVAFGDVLILGGFEGELFAPPAGSATPLPAPPTRSAI